MKIYFGKILFGLLVMGSNKAGAITISLLNYDKVTKCESSPLAIKDFSIQLEKKWNVKCELQTKGFEPLIGFIYICGKNTAAAFLNMADCEKWLKAKKSNPVVDYKSFIPDEVKNKEEYAKALTNCISQQGGNRSAEFFAAYCVCSAKKISIHTEKEMEEMNREGTLMTYISDVISSCSTAK